MSFPTHWVNLGHNIRNSVTSKSSGISNRIDTLAISTIVSYLQGYFVRSNLSSILPITQDSLTLGSRSGKGGRKEYFGVSLQSFGKKCFQIHYSESEK